MSKGISVELCSKLLEVIGKELERKKMKPMVSEKNFNRLLEVVSDMVDENKFEVKTLTDKTLFKTIQAKCSFYHKDSNCGNIAGRNDMFNFENINKHLGREEPCKQETCPKLWFSLLSKDEQEDFLKTTTSVLSVYKV